MTPSNFVINDSEGESDGVIYDDGPTAQLETASTAPPIPPYQAPDPGADGYQTVPASGELRKKAIDDAHAALLWTTPVSPTQTNSKVKRRQTAHGRLEGGEGQDVYGSGDDDDFYLDSEGKKRKRPSPEKKDMTKPSKKPAKRAKSAGRGMSVLDLLNDTSEDDWHPNTSKTPTSGKKSTRGNTVDTDLLPPLPKPKRKQRESVKTTPYYDPQQFDGNLTLNFSRSSEPFDTRSAEIQVAATESTAQTIASTFMVDLTSENLILPVERRAEYDAVSPELSPAELQPNFYPSHSGGVYDTPDLRSTIPDPSYDQNLPPSQIAAHLARTFAHIPESHPLAPQSVASDSPLSSLENSPAKPAKKKPKEKKRAATDQHLGLAGSPEGHHGFDSFPVASEWRAAKGKARQGMAQATYAGRAKTSNAVDLLAAGGGGGSEDDIWVGDGKGVAKKKKPAAKKRKSTANDGDLGTETGVQKAKPKRRKSKAVETVVIGSSGDELSGGRKENLSPQGVIQVVATASTDSPSNPQTIGHQKSKALDELNDTIAVSDPLAAEAKSGNQLTIEEYKPPTGPKKVHRFPRPKFLDEPYDQGDSPSTLGVISGPSAVDAAATNQSVTFDHPVVTEQEQEVSHEPIKPTRKETAAAAKRRKSKKDESEEEDWTGDPEPAKKPAAKKETKAKTPRMTKKAAAAAAKEQKEKEKTQLSPEMIKDSDDEDDAIAPPAALVEPEPEKPAPAPEPTRKGTKKIPAKKAGKKAATSKETVSDAEDADEKDNSTPVPEAKKEEPQTPSKILMESRRKTPHSPINKGAVKFRVGLSRRAHIEPLLKIIRK